MVNRLPSWLFMAIAMLLMGFALFPLLRVALGIDEQFEIEFWTVVFLLIAGLMCGLTGMLLLVRRQPDLLSYKNDQMDHKTAAKIHATGLLLFTAIPLLNFFACYFLWIRNRHISQYIDYQGREAICFQITIYLYLLLGLFMTLAVIGIFAIPLLLFLHLIVTLVATAMAAQGEPFRYPANITIIARTPTQTEG